MPTNCKGQDKPGARPPSPCGRGWGQGSARVPRQEGRARGGRGSGTLPVPGSAPPTEPGASPCTPWSTGPSPAGSRGRSHARGGDRWQRDSRRFPCRGNPTATCQRGSAAAGAQLHTPGLGNAALLPSLRRATPTVPEGNRSRPPPLPEATGCPCQLCHSSLRTGRPWGHRAQRGWRAWGCQHAPTLVGDAHGSLSRCVNTERFVCRQNLQPCQLLRSPGDAPSLREGSRAVLPFGMPRNPGGRRLLPFGRAERGEAAVGARRGAEPRLRSPCQDVLATFPNTDTPAAKSELAGGLALPSLSGPRLPLR